MRPKVWTVILSWNGREDTLACLETLAKQTVQPDEILVVDNGSRDGLEAPLRQRFPRARYLFNERNLGFAGGMNLGVNRALAAGADYIFTPNNDTLLAPKCLEYLSDALDRYPDAAGVAPKIYFYDPPGKIYFNGGYFTRATVNPRHSGNREDRDLGKTEIRKTGFLNACCPLFRARALRETGLYDEAFFAYYEDGDLSLRLLKKGWKLLLAPAAEVIHRHGVSCQKNTGQNQKGNTSSTKWFLMTRNRLWLLRKHGRWWQKAIGVPFILASRSVLMVLQVLRGRPQKAGGVLKGLAAGMLTTRLTERDSVGM